MATSNFIDTATIWLHAGKGGDGQDETTTKAAHYRFMRPIMRHERQLGGHLTDGAY